MKRIAFCLTLLVASVCLGADWPRHRMRPGLVPGIPDRDYKLIEPSATPIPNAVTALSFKSTDIVGPDGKIKLRTFSMDQTVLKSLHCSIAHASFTINAAGEWSFSARADQNPWFTTTPNALPPLKLNLPIETNHLLRTAFALRVRCLGNVPMKEIAKTMGVTTIADIEVARVWVQRGVPLTIKNDGKDDGLAKYYVSVERVQFELGFARDGLVP